MTVNFVWEGRQYPVECKDSTTSSFGEYIYIDFVSLFEQLGKDGREDLISTLLINHYDEVEEISEAVL